MGVRGFREEGEEEEARQILRFLGQNIPSFPFFCLKLAEYLTLLA